VDIVHNCTSLPSEDFKKYSFGLEGIGKQRVSGQESGTVPIYDKRYKKPFLYYTFPFRNHHSTSSSKVLSKEIFSVRQWMPQRTVPGVFNKFRRYGR
jgi:hypothetical protein